MTICETDRLVITICETDPPLPKYYELDIENPPLPPMYSLHSRSRIKRIEIKMIVSIIATILSLLIFVFALFFFMNIHGKR
jgi:hypothetical protein